MPPPARNFLTLEQIQELQQALKESDQPHVRERILTILLQNDGEPQHEIAKFLGCSPRTVAYWCMHGDPDNLETLHNKRLSCGDSGHHGVKTVQYFRLEEFRWRFECVLLVQNRDSDRSLYTHPQSTAIYH